MRIRYLMRSPGGGAKDAAREGLIEVAVPETAGEAGGEGGGELDTEREGKSTRRDGGALRAMAGIREGTGSGNGWVIGEGGSAISRRGQSPAPASRIDAKSSQNRPLISR